MSRYLIALLIVSGFQCVIAGDFLAGADMSHARFFEDRGVIYRADGAPRDVFDILKERGVNCVRLRIFTSNAQQASSDPYNYINNLDYTLPLAVRVKNAGSKLLLDFHYSDSWADPGKQNKPQDWESLGFAQLEEQSPPSSSNSISALKVAGAMPDYVQVGNEIIGGMLWDEGRVGGGFDNSTQWAQLGRLVKAAINGIHGAAGDTPPKIIVHIDRGGDWGATRWFFDNLNNQSVPYDIIGESYYPWWHGDLDDLRNCLTNAALRYGKPIIIAETAYPWADSQWDPDTGLAIPSSPNGQVEFLRELAAIVNTLPGGLGKGIFWWGSEYVEINGYNLAGFQRRSFFDEDGDVLPIVEAMGSLNSEVLLKAERNGQGLELEWPLSGAGLALTSSTSPSPSAVWTQVTNPVVSTGAVYRVNVPVDGSDWRLYRLEQD